MVLECMLANSTEDGMAEAIKALAGLDNDRICFKQCKIQNTVPTSFSHLARTPEPRVFVPFRPAQPPNIPLSLHSCLEPDCSIRAPHTPASAVVYFVLGTASAV